MGKWWKVLGGSFLLLGFLGFIFYRNIRPAQNIDGPASSVNRPVLKFRLASEGLPDSGMWKSTPAVLEMNGTGKPALAAHPRLGNGARVWLKDENGKWAEASEGLRMDSGPSCGGGVAFGDINRDGYLDLAIADHCSGIWVYAGNADGRWTPVTRSLNPQQAAPEPDANNEKIFFRGAEDLALGDINEDGFLDIVAAASDMGGFTVYSGDGAFGWTEAAYTGLPTAQNPEIEDKENAGWANQVRLVDINGDGHLDVVASYYRGPSVWLGDGKGHFTPASKGLPRPTIGGLYRGVAIGDINGDGLPDLVFANQVNGPEVFFQQPDGSWRQAPDVFPSLRGGAIAVALADLTGDGNQDLIVTGRKTREDETFGMFVLKGDGKGGFVEAETNLPDTGLSLPWGVAIADLDNHGAKDIVVTTGGVSPRIKPAKKQAPSAQDSKDGGNLAAQPPLPRVQAWLNETKTSGKTGPLSITKRQ